MCINPHLLVFGFKLSALSSTIARAIGYNLRTFL
jgi:hypothetical protein